jgi:kinesin family protein 11
MLAQMLVDERAKTNKLRGELIGNLTNLIADFTDAQDASWSAAVGGVLAENETGVEQMGTFASGVDERWSAGIARSQELASELDMAQNTSMTQRTTGRDVSDAPGPKLTGRHSGRYATACATGSRCLAGTARTSWRWLSGVLMLDLGTSQVDWPKVSSTSLLHA